MFVRDWGEAMEGERDNLSRDRGVGRFLEFRIVRDPRRPDLSLVPDTLIPNRDLPHIPVARERVFEFGAAPASRTATQTRRSSVR